LATALFGLFAAALQPSAHGGGNTSASGSHHLNGNHFVYQVDHSFEQHQFSDRDLSFGPNFDHGGDIEYGGSGDEFEQNTLAKLFGHTGLMVLCAAAGVVRGVADPLFFEMTAEVVSPFLKHPYEDPLLFFQRTRTFLHPNDHGHLHFALALLPFWSLANRCLTCLMQAHPAPAGAAGSVLTFVYHVV
jgi:hypothetical protein